MFRAISVGNRVTTILSLHFRDGSLYEEKSVFSQSNTFRLLTYRQIQKGAAFKSPETLALDTRTGDVNIEAADKDGKMRNIAKRLSLPADLANGIITILLNDVDSNVETTLSMLVATPEPRVVKLRISASGQDSFSIGGWGDKAAHYVVKVDVGGVTGVVAKAAGKQPPPPHIWINAGSTPVFQKSEGPLYEDGPIWRIELASPTWPKSAEPR
ncbi:MAG: hypothetical protein ABSH56_03230 [Bryobacteraceae bacterium]|jgi:hypothetical protein